MIGYVTLGTNDLARAAVFYDAIAGELGVPRMMEFDGFIAWGKEGGMYKKNAQRTQLMSQFRQQCLRQHHHSILGALAFAHDQRPLSEVQVLDPQLQCLCDSKARAVEQTSQQ